MKILKIAAPKSLMQYVSKQWPVVELASTLKGAELAAMVVSAESEDEMRLATAVQAKSMLDIPVVKVDITQPAVDITREIDAAALQYEKKMVPRFLTDLVEFADRRPISFTTPGHHNGRYNESHPAGVVFNRFFGENMLYADTSDTVAELGDTMTHAGSPLEAEQKTAEVYHADKAYFCPNGTTGSNDICASAVLRPGDLVLFDRNNHKSLYNGALIMNGAKPVYIPNGSAIFDRRKIAQGSCEG